MRNERAERRFRKFPSRPVFPERALRRCVLFSYSMSKMKQSDKMRLIRKLYGNVQKKGEKTYETEGILKELGGEKIGENVIMVPKAKEGIIESLFFEYSIFYEKKDVQV